MKPHRTTSMTTNPKRGTTRAGLPRIKYNCRSMIARARERRSEGVFTLRGSRFSVRVQVRFGVRGSRFEVPGSGFGVRGSGSGFGYAERFTGHGDEQFLER